MNMKQEPFGETPDGTSVTLYTLTNRNGVEARIINYGGIVVSLKVPDRDGNLEDVVLGHDNLEGYLKDNSPYLGALIGRYGNRISRGRFTLNGVEYQLAQNNGENHLHGGLRGFDQMVWQASPVAQASEEAQASGETLELTYLSRDGEEGYPGNLSVTVRYTLTDEDELRIEYAATTDKETILNLTNHSYFNLAGAGRGDILGHEVMINANRFTPINAGLIPTGELASVEGTPMDFTEPATIGSRIGEQYEQLLFGLGYDHNWVLNKDEGSLKLAARVYARGSGRVMEVYTTQPGMQFYSGNFLDGTIRGKGGKVYRKRYGFCMETQHFPDSPNHPNFPSTILSPGQKYNQTTIYKFSTR
jgi:aldose 1-epimerase